MFGRPPAERETGAGPTAEPQDGAPQTATPPCSSTNPPAGPSSAPPRPAALRTARNWPAVTSGSFVPTSARAGAAHTCGRISTMPFRRCSPSVSARVAPWKLPRQVACPAFVPSSTASSATSPPLRESARAGGGPAAGPPGERGEPVAAVRAYLGPVAHDRGRPVPAAASRRTGPEAVQRVELLRLRFEENLPIRTIAERWGVAAAERHHAYALGRQEFRAALLEVVAFHHPGSPAEVEQEAASLLRAQS
jgi:hypothetical protein